ncbi:hypothetical protein OHB41_38135 [Streptomyces sp. NBC_01571]|uniref:hypothetical protein n=1 Tax=Streptomyces sp. NBC_01571 TaxID=2975883 RepID=UPI00224CA0B5|nr:hypothetical protein [Streptomyces sp. NBC_01571]MCX4578907.1 hypothetical protein [Streptomyces sp. NBC_01571]
MNPIRNGRAVLFFLPYVLVVSGILAASKAADAPGVAFQALGIAAIGALWAWRRGRRSGY